MYFTSPLSAYCKGSLRLLKRRRVFRMTAHFYGRRRNCYTLAIRALCRSLRRTSIGNKEKHKDRQRLYSTRINAACEHLGVPSKVVRDGLDRSGIFLSRRTMSDLSIWEPRSFQALAHLGWKRAAEDGLNGVAELGDVPKGIITRGMLKKEK